MSVNKAPVGNRSAEIVDMRDARARRLGGDFPLGEYAHAGALLAAARESAGLTLHEVAASTHIKEYHLAAIEAIDRGALPPRPYAIGFVKVYAEFLGLDAAPVVIRFKEEAEYAAPVEVDAEKFEAAQDAAEIEGARMSVWAVAAVMAFIIWCAWQLSRPQDVTLLGDVQGSLFERQGDEREATSAGDGLADVEIVEARIVARVEPVYPRGCAMNAAAMETVVVDYRITAAGRIAGMRVSQSTNACFDDAALNAIKRWRFEPRTVDGAARPAYDQKYSFSFQRPH